MSNSPRRPRTYVTLQPGDPIPAGEPIRSVVNGYVVLRWLIAPRTYAQAYEHRLMMGELSPDVMVHHRNKNRSDNRYGNLCVHKVGSNRPPAPEEREEQRRDAFVRELFEVWQSAQGQHEAWQRARAAQQLCDSP